ncbi:MAG: 16S rRNA (cytidine(1402)-2'-O)-methyltransferase [Aquabacterium sp.]|uniref:16S rRNA (cytidine(1402)-2'-O)-methyltransferase n=1 Tax=Aquabacterium sp. TaxID=1872578 RepID=UPI002A365403|nr:16S rRNA (cytidine(1402)-2'-O)-methyltransferase [Aquabacterium sp.]MDX9842578.1 16S rRNA (cytidine(1402)-2'-O)-methyltransferase [Aquabacterium sp.]
MTIDANLLLQAAQHVAGGQQYPKGALYLIATPIGNLADITLRAVQALTLADVVACEDTRVTGGFLRHLGMDKRLLPLHQHNEVGGAQALIALMQAGQRVAYVSDAGTPAVSDPGAHLVQAVQAAGLTVVPLPGASSVTTAMSVAGDTVAQGFRFLGFLPAKGTARQAQLREVLGQSHSVVLFEAPHRIDALARDLVEVLPHGRLTLCRELTKQFEEIATLPVADFPAWLTAEAHRQRGEFVIVVHAQPEEAAETLLTPAQATLLQALVQHLPVKQAAGLLADVTGLPRKALYEQALTYRQADDAR